MAQNEAYRRAEQKIEKARHSGAKELDLRGSSDAKASEKLTELPESLCQLSHLQSLNLSHNRLTALPELLGPLSRLLWLNLTDNRLTMLPESLAALVIDRARSSNKAAPGRRTPRRCVLSNSRKYSADFGPEKSGASLECADSSALWSHLGRAFRVGTKAVTSHRTPRRSVFS